MTKGQYDQLLQRIEQHNYLYYQVGAPVLPDHEFDQWMQNVREAEAQHPDWVTPASPTQRVLQQPLKGFIQVQHREPMLSLDNMFNQQDVDRFCQRLLALDPDAQVLIEPKVDGLAVSVLYRNGLLARALTRGNGQQGDDITAQARTIRNLPLRLQAPFPPVVEVRGEIHIEKRDFETVNQQRQAEGQDLFANPRNAAVGGIKSLDTRETSARRLSVRFYEMLSDDPPDTELMYRQLQLWGLPVLPYMVTTPADPATVMSDIQACRDHFSLMPFMTDGAVVKLTNRTARHELGYSSAAPRWAAAFKYPPEEVVTVLQGVTVQAGRHGTLTPVAEVQAVHVGGSIVRRATLHNWDEIARLDIRIGDQVVLIKAGEIIPSIRRVLTEARTGTEQVIPTPDRCPFCGGPVDRDGDDAVAIRCLTYACSEVAKRRLAHMVSKDALDLEGVGPQVVELLYRAGIRDLPGLMRLELQDLRNAGLGDVTAPKVLQRIRALPFKTPQDRLLYSLSIPHVGRTASRAIVSHFGGLQPAVDASYDAITTCPDLLPIPAESFCQWAVNSGQVILESLRQWSFTLDAQERVVAGDSLAGQTWVITGTLSAEREIFEAMIRSHGGKVSGSVSKKTTAVLAGDKAGSKLTKAQTIGVEVVDETEFRRRIGA